MLYKASVGSLEIGYVLYIFQESTHFGLKGPKYSKPNLNTEKLKVAYKQVKVVVSYQSQNETFLSQALLVTSLKNTQIKLIP